ncbi:RHS repeat-associated core domain-containing protein [Actinosynnema sp. NPDC020468]|uniref:RHS repeat-associated core domain-containing protein n=1 Tax=Actinosynnema sp. NPDC020468 TaxID=3154488 RepID=UPI0033D02860
MTAARGRMTRAVALAAAVVFGLSTAQASAAPGNQYRWKLPELQKEKSVPVSAVDTRALPDDTSAAKVVAQPARKATFPAPATGAVDFAAASAITARAAGAGVRVAGTPVSVGLAAVDAVGARARKADAGKVRVQVHPRKAELGPVVFSLTDGGGAADAPVDVTLDYRSFAPSFGGDYASRLKLVQLPACALSTPDKPECRTQTPVENPRNDPKSGTVSGRTTMASSGPVVLAAAAATSSGAGTYSATSLAPAGSWSAGSSSGDFTYSVPMRVPPALSGSTPSVALGYSAQSLDGRTSATNNQASWAGDGWDISPGGFIERTYKPCSLDLGGNNGQTKYGDQCWGTDNATISLVGVSGKLVNIPGTEQWRAQNDDGAKVEHLYGATNGDNNGEYWKVTTTDGTQYFLGQNRLPGWVAGKPETQSAWTVPVYGNNSGEPCNAAAYADSWCQQAYRWNLDYVVDPHGNVTTYYYDREFNYYGRQGDAAKGTQYVRAGTLNRVEYGLRSTAVYDRPAAKVEFETAERCLPSGAITCAPAQLTAANAASWPDVPFDQICDSGQQCANRLTPSFFTRKRLTRVVTRYAKDATTFQDVDSWTLTHEFLATGDGLAPAMNLKQVVHTGLVGGSTALPPTTFSHKALDNRVDDSTDDQPAITRYRIDRITGEAGGVTQVEYSGPDCVRGTRMPTAPESNTLRCYPTWWTPDGGQAPILDYFHKYVVTAVTEDDRTGGSSLVKTRYEYDGDPAWHYDEADFAEPARRTWSQWRGYGVVRTIRGDPAGTQSVGESLYLRGMDGDKLPSGTRSVSVADSEGASVVDSDRLRGFVRETRQYTAGALVSASVNDPWLPTTPTATDSGGLKAFVNGTASVRGRTKIADGTWRRTRVDKTFNTEGVVTRVEDLGDTAVTGDESCTRYTYARNETAWIITLASAVETVTGTCAVTASAATVQSSARSYFDNQALGVAPTRGLITKAEVLDKWDASGQTWVTASRASYDSYGRPLDVWDSSDNKTTTAYTPATGPVTEVTSTNPLGHVAKEQLNPAWGLSVGSTDANNRHVDLALDPLGRLVSAWLPGHDKNAQGVKADAVFEYQFNNDKPSVVVSKQLQDDNQYRVGYTLYDGLLRERQNQVPATGPDGGRLVSDTYYDTRGLAWKQNSAYWNSAAASGTLVGAFDNEVPNQTITEYDGMGRPTAAIFRRLGVEQWRTTTLYAGDRVSTTPPPGSPAVVVINDAHGRTKEKRQYTAGLGSTYDTTSYAYTPAGQLKTVTDPAGNAWSYTYDLRGRVVATDDPDAGHSTSTYDVAGRVVSTTDAQNRTVSNVYDKLGRVTARYSGPTTGTKIAEWEYDTLPGGLGVLQTSRRFAGGGTYTRKTTELDAAGRPKGQKVIVPAAQEGVLGTTYELSQTYTYTGKPDTVTYKAVTSGGTTIVPAETVGVRYNASGQLNDTIGTDVYVDSTSYSSYGEVLQEVQGGSGASVKNVWTTNTYEVGTRRLATTSVVRETATAEKVADRAYGYDASGNVLRVADTPAGAASDVQCYAYDHLRRLSEAWTPSSTNCGDPKSTSALGGAAPYWQSWTFDKTGNRLTETTHAAAGDTVRTTAYPAAGAVRPHTATSVTTTSPTGTALDTFGYDTSGRTTSRTAGGNAQTLEYDVEGRLSRVVTGTQESKYLYDAEGARLISREPSATTLYVFGQEIRLEKNTTTPTWTRQYTHNGHVVAVRNSVSGLKWMAGDHQGTNQVAINPATMDVTQRRQTPYGGARGGVPASWPDRLGFVGGRNDESGLVTVGARQYDTASGRFLSADPVIDNNDPQQLNGYAYANNNPVTYSDPTGLFINCGPDGVACGLHAASSPYPSAGSNYTPTYYQERDTYIAINRQVQYQQTVYKEEMAKAMAEQGISAEDYAKALEESHKTKWDVIKEVAWEVLKDISGWNDIVDCFTKGDIMACGGLVLGLVPWGKVGKILQAGVKAFKAVERLASIVDKAQGIVRKVGDLAKKAAAAVTERLGKVGGKAESIGGSCPIPASHSFVGATTVVMADGSEKPISEVRLGDRVKATDPETGQTTDRDVVATFVHSDEGDLVKLTVAAADGSTGSVDGTSWHPVWVDSEHRFVDLGELTAGSRLTSVDGTHPAVADVEHHTRYEPVYDLTVEGVHTYYVVAGGTPVLVHNCGTRIFAVDSAGEATSLPVHEIDSGVYSGVADNFTNAVSNGASPIVTRMTGRSAIRANRAAAQAGQPRPGTLADGMSWEEFPFASTREGGAGATLRLIPRAENVSHGRDSLWPFLRDNGIGNGDQYYVRTS